MYPRNALILKIAYIIPNFNIGGVQKLVLQIASNSGLSKDAQMVIAINKSENLLESKFKQVSNNVLIFPLVRSLPYFRPYYVFSKINRIYKSRFTKRKCLRLLNLLKRENVDIIHIHTFEFNTVHNLLKYASRYKIKFIVTFHGNTNYPETTWEKLSKFFKNIGSVRVTQVSEDNNETLNRLAEKKNFQIDVIPNGIDLAPFQSHVKDKNALRELIGEHNKEVKLVVCVGRLKKIKGQDILIDAIANMTEKDKVRLVIIGEGKNRPKLETLVKNLCLDGQVDFLGQRRDIPNILAGADIFVLPSRSEGEPLALLEALASGLPVITTDVGSCASIIEDGFSGFVVPPEDPQALAKAIDRLICEPKLRAIFSKNAKKRAASYSINKTVARYHDLYSQLCQQ